MDSQQLMTKLNQKPATSQELAEYRAGEWYKCRQNPLYFIYNYVYIPETGGRLLYAKELMHPKMRRVVRSVFKYHKCVLMASRQLGKSTLAACLIAWAVVFYSRNRAVILNMKQEAGLNNLAMIKFIISNLPEWMVGKNPFKSKSDIKTYFELFNDSKVSVVYPSTVHDPNTLARSLTVPILYIDESAFIRSMREIYGSAQQTLATAREQAKKNGYPYFQLITSTPNGTQGDGEWFYDRWQGAVESDDVFEVTENGLEDWRENSDEIISDPSKNTFVRVMYHWSEDPRKNEKWYKEQCQELSDRRLINQELDLVFVGSTNCIFSDEILGSIKEVKPKEIIQCMHGSQLRIFEQHLDPTDYYIIGCDTAESLEGADCAIQVYSFRKFHQVAELQHKFGSYTNFGQVIHYVFQWVYRQVQSRIILIIENNTIGKAPIEYLTKNPEITDHFNYHPFLFKEKEKDNTYQEQYGVKTTGMTKPLMIGLLVEAMNEDISCIRSRNLKLQCSAAYQTTAGTVKFSTHSDLFMATCFCAFARKREFMKIMPLIAFTNEQLQNQYLNDIKDISQLSDPKSAIKHDARAEQMIYDSDESIILPMMEDDDTSSIFPFFIS